MNTIERRALAALHKVLDPGGLVFGTCLLTVAGVGGRFGLFGGLFGDKYLNPFFAFLLPYAIGLLVLAVTGVVLTRWLESRVEANVDSDVDWDALLRHTR